MPLQSPPLLVKEIIFSKPFIERKIPKPLAYISCNVLPTVTKSPWNKLYQCHNNKAMITFTCFDERCFYYVLVKFANMFDAFTPFVDCKITLLEGKKCWLKRMIHPEDCLGLVLSWTRMHGSMVAL